MAIEPTSQDEDRADGTSTWTFISKIDMTHMPRMIVHARIVDSTFINISVDEPGNYGDELVDQVLHSCRQKYGKGAPRFPQSIFIDMKKDCADKMQPKEQIDPLLLKDLPTISNVFSDITDLPPIIPSTELSSVLIRDAFLLPNTRVVTFRGENHVAKGPIYVSRIDDDFNEIRNLLQLRPGCPYIIPRPSALIKVSETDERLCGFLMPFYRRGNLDIYARRLREKNDTIDTARLCRWFRQLICAVKFLTANHTWHGDLKPDNLLVDDEENIVLTDFARKFSTSATASPEVHDDHLARLAVKEQPYPALGIPSHWSLDAIVQSEVYSICRTMYLVCEGISMEEIYHTLGWVNTGHTFSTEFGETSTTPQPLRQIIAKGTVPEPSERISIDALSEEVKALEATFERPLRRSRADSKVFSERTE